MGAKYRDGSENAKIQLALPSNGRGCHIGKVEMRPWEIDKGMEVIQSGSWHFLQMEEDVILVMWKCGHASLMKRWK